MPVLRIRVEPQGRTAVINAPEILLGRSTYCSVVLDHPSVSRVHASVRPTDDGVDVLDLSSRNGTFVNGKRLGEAPCRAVPGDEIKVGSVVLHIEEVPAALYDTTQSQDSVRSVAEATSTGSPIEPDSDTQE